MNLSCNITAFGLTAIEHSNCENALLEQKTKYPPLKNIPMMQARRMSIASKLATEVFMHFSKNHDLEYTIFLSAHGEIERSYAVIANIINQNEISPTDFSMSVHNTASGVSGILAKNANETTSIAGGPHGFITIIYEVIAALSAGKNSVLLIAFDGEMPEFYTQYGAIKNDAYAVGILFEKGSDYLLSLSQSTTILLPKAQNNSPLPLIFWNEWQLGKSISLLGPRQSLNIEKLLP